MKTSKAIQVAVAAALALALNGVAAAQSMQFALSDTRVAATALVPNSPFKPFVANTPFIANTVNGGPSGRFFPVQAIGGSGRGGVYGQSPVLPCVPVPEPSTYLLMLAGVCLIGFMSYRHQRCFSSTDPVWQRTNFLGVNLFK